MKFWKQIKKKYPEACEKFLDEQTVKYNINIDGLLQYRGDVQHFYQKRNLFDYFDSKKMYIEIEIEPVNRVYDVESIDSFYAAIVIGDKRTELTLLKTRAEAEESAFEYCFLKMQHDIKPVAENPVPVTRGR